jgi:hypothetical protein
MGATKTMLISEQEVTEAAIAPKQKQSIFNIRQDHLTLLAVIEENEGVLTEEQEKALQLTEDNFKDKAISYAYVVKMKHAESDTIDAEIKRLQRLKQKADNSAKMFEQRIDEGLKQFGLEKIDTALLKIGYRKSRPIELSDGFVDSILKFADVSITLSEEKVRAAKEAGEEVSITENMLSYFDLDASVSKKRIGQALKEGMVIPGASMPEKKNLQIM